METNLTISIIDECLKNTDLECEDILKTKEALNILKQEKHKISDKYKRLDNEISSKKEEIKKLGYSIENKKPTLNQKQTELDQAISMHASYKSDLSVAESENCWRHSPGRYDQNCLNKKENIRDKVNHWSRYKSKYQNEKNDIESDIKAFEDKKQKIVKEIAALEEKSKTLSENEDINYLNKMLDGIMYYQHQEDLEDINVINDSSYVHSINQVEAAYQN